MSKTEQNRLSEWHKAAVALSSRAEELQNATETFAETIFLDALKAKQNQIIYGRRGTGKTHLLKRFQEECISEFQEFRSVPIFVNGSKLRHQANILIERPIVIALSLYVEFIKMLTTELHKFITSQIDPHFWDRLTGGKKIQTAKKAKTIATDLCQLLQKGEVRFLPVGEASDEVQTLNETVATVTGGITLNLADPRNLGWKLDLGARGLKESKKRGITLRKIQGQVILPFSQVATMIQELLALLDGASLFVLFDEWSDVDQRRETQPYLADMIKRTLSSITQMHVKLSCIPVRTLLASPVTADNPISIGYEEGDDIIADVNLDSVVFIENDLKQFLPFFMILLKKHMGMELDWVKSMKKSKFEKFISGEVFEGFSTFSELCQASAGVPRDFLNLFRHATSIQVSQNADKIKLKHIRNAAIKLHESKKISFKPGSPELSLLDYLYREIIAKHRTYFFLLPEERFWHPLICMLWAERLIHKMPASYYNIDANIKYNYYQMDYGKCVDLMAVEAAISGGEKGRQWASAISISSTGQEVGWLGAIISKSVEAILPKLMSFAAEKQAIANNPAGNMSPDPKAIIVDDAIFE